MSAIQIRRIMKVFSIFLLLSPFWHPVNVICVVIGDDDPVISFYITDGQTILGLADLRTPTPFTYTITKVASGCKTNESTFVVYFTWEIQGKTFLANNSISIVFSTDGVYT